VSQEYGTVESLREELRSSRLRGYELMEQRLADRTRQLTAIYAITAKASGPLAPEALLAEVLDLILDVAGAVAGGIQLFDAPRDLPRSVATRGLADGALTQPLGGTAVGEWLREQNRPLLVRDTTIDPRTSPLAWLPRGQAGALVPIHARGHLRGVLVVARAWGRPFTEDEAALLAAIGDQLGVAAEHARLFAEVQDRATQELRLALSRDLHDSLTQSLYSLTLLTEVTTRQLRLGDPALVEEYLAQLGTTARQATKEMRLLIYELRSATLADETLADAIERRFAAVERRAGVAARLKVAGGDDLPVAARTELFQLVQEALNNVLKHATASQVLVELREQGEYLELRIADDGRGFDPDRLRDHGGLGLASMRERAATLGGSVTFSPAVGGGTEVVARVPLARIARRAEFDLARSR
jgi:signal transduction histidine kinase